MGEALPIARGGASEVVAANCVDLQKSAIGLVAVAESCKWFPGLAKKLWPGKTAAAVHHLTGEPERSCYAWVEAKNDPPSRAIIRILHTDQGWRVLEYLMRGCKQPWWQEVVRARLCAAAYEQAREQLELDL